MPNDEKKHILTVESLACRMGGKEILRKVCLTIPAGAFVSLIGPNGAGKTTLIKCLNRIIPRQGGEIFIDGIGIDHYSQPNLAGKLAYVPQAQGRHLEFSVFEFVLLSRFPHLSPFSSVSSRDRKIVRNALEITGMCDFAERTHATLSGGERQKVFIAAALAQEAPILLLDEPTTFLDPHHQEEIMGILRRINHEERRTILSVTHDLNGAMLASDLIYAMKDGRIIFSGTPEQAMTRETLRAVYGAEFLFAAHPVTGQPMLVPGQHHTE